MYAHWPDTVSSSETTVTIALLWRRGNPTALFPIRPVTSVLIFPPNAPPLPELKPVTDRSELCKTTERVAELLFESILSAQFDYDEQHRHVRLSKKYRDFIPLLLETTTETVCKNSLQVVSSGSRDV